MPLPDLKLSRRHCQISLSANKAIVRDLGSTNGTYVNGARISADVELNDFDRIVLGDTEIEFHGEMEALPKNFDSNANDPFGLNNDEDILPEDAIPIVPPIPKAAPVPQVPPVAVPPSPKAAKAAALEFDVDLDVGPVVSAPVSAPAPVPMPAAAAPIAAPRQVAVEIDPIEEALADLRKPLPPEPPGSQSTSPAVKVRAQLRFCDVCSGSIPVLDWDLGQAKEINGSNICKDCLAAGAQVPAKPLIPAGSTAPASPAVMAPPAPAKKSIDDMLAGLEEEAVIVDTSVKRRGTALDEQEAQRKIGQIQKLQEATATRPTLQQPQVKNPPPKADTLKETLGDDFEEIG